MSNFPKSFILFLILLSNCVLTSAQLPIDYIFNNRDDIFLHKNDSGIKPLYWNNGILYLGFCVKPNSQYGMTLTFCDTLGNINWKKTFFNPAYSVLQGNDIVAFNNSGFYVGGVLRSDSLLDDQFFAKFDSNGDSIFFKIYPDTSSTFLEDAEVFSPDTILLLSIVGFSNGADYTKYLITSVDTVGNILSVVSDSVAPTHLAFQILKSNDYIYVAGTYKTDTGWYYNDKVFVDRWNYNLSQMNHWQPSITVNDIFNQLNFWNGKIYLTSVANVAVTHYGVRIGVLNSLGTLQNCRRNVAFTCTAE